MQKSLLIDQGIEYIEIDERLQKSMFLVGGQNRW
jgi:hypothetical protein